MITFFLHPLMHALPVQAQPDQDPLPFQGALVYTAPDGNLYGLSAMDTQPRPITKDAGEGRANHSPRVSADGDWLAYLQVGTAGAAISGTLFLTSLSAIEPITVSTAVKSLAWAPDPGNPIAQLAFVDSRDELYGVDPAAPPPQLLTNSVLEFRWLPGSRQIAFTVTDAKACTPLDNPPGGGVYIFDLDQFLVYELFNLEPAGSRLVHLDISPDGRWFSVCNGGCSTDCMPSLWDQSTKESRPANVLGWSPDGRFYLAAALSTFEAAPAPLLAVDTQSNQQITLYEEENHAPLAAVWSPDGTRIAVQSAPVDPTTGYGPPQVLLVSPDGDTRRTLGKASQAIGGWSPDGQAILLYDVPAPDVARPASVPAQLYATNGAEIGLAFEMAYPVHLEWTEALLARPPEGAAPPPVVQDTPAAAPSPTSPATPTTLPAAPTIEPAAAVTEPADVAATPGAGSTGSQPGLGQLIPVRSGLLVYVCSLAGLLLLAVLGLVLLRRRSANRTNRGASTGEPPPEELPDEAYPRVSWSHDVPPAAQQPPAPSQPALEPERPVASAPQSESRQEPELPTTPAVETPQPPAEPPAGEPAASQVRAWLEEGLSQARAGQYPVAFQSLRRVVQADPKNASAWMGLGFVLMRQNNLDAAGECLRRAQALGHPDAGRALADLAARSQPKD